MLGTWRSSPSCFRSLGEDDFEPDGSPIAPTEEDVRQAISDGDRIQETEGGAGTPVIGEDTPIYSPILGLGSPGLIIGVTLGAGSPAQRRGLRPGTARARRVDGVAGASFPRPLVRPEATRSQRARGRRRRLSRRRSGGG